MSLLLAAAVVTATAIPAAQVDLASPTIYVSDQARDAIADGSVDTLACLDLPKRSKKFRTACLTPAEWDKAAKTTALNKRVNGVRYDVFPYQPVPAQSSPYQSSGGR